MTLLLELTAMIALLLQGSDAQRHGVPDGSIVKVTVMAWCAGNAALFIWEGGCNPTIMGGGMQPCPVHLQIPVCAPAHSQLGDLQAEFLHACVCSCCQHIDCSAYPVACAAVSVVYVFRLSV